MSILSSSMMIVRVAKVRGSQFARIARVRVRLDDAVCLYSAGSNSESVETVMATGKYLVLRHSGTQGDGDAGRVGCLGDIGMKYLKWSFAVISAVVALVAVVAIWINIVSAGRAERRDGDKAY